MIKGEHSLLHHVQSIFESGTIGELTDGQLLERFAGRDCDMAELCFAVLIKRHGPMVFRAARPSWETGTKLRTPFRPRSSCWPAGRDRCGSPRRS